MARTVEDVAILLQAIAGHDPLDDGSADVPIPDYVGRLRNLPSGMTIGVPWRYLEGLDDLDAEMLTIFRAAVRDLEGLGLRIKPVEIPNLERAGDIGTSILVSEAYTIHEQGFREHLDLYGKPFRSRVLRGALLTAADYLQATRARGRFRRGMAEVMTGVDLIAMPTGTSGAERFDDPSVVPYGRTSFTRIFNITGQPSISVPCGFVGESLPAGLMLSGRPFDELTVLQVAHAYEQSHEWHRRQPPL
jgi:aspartyl-tRNA(Asn)/glutamyl-tRNA(Gln) amidotransferase subunit A